MGNSSGKSNKHSNQTNSNTTTTNTNPFHNDDTHDYDSSSSTTQSNTTTTTQSPLSSSLSLDTWDEKRLHYWFSIVLIQDVIIQLPLCDLKQCTLVCKSISKLVRDYMQLNFWFQQHDKFSDQTDHEKRYLWYSPHQFKNVKNTSTLPINTTKIQFFPTFNSPFTFPLHLQQVTHIKFGYLFNQQIGCGIKSEINNLPLTLTHLEFSTYFNQSVDDLPPNLTFLSFNYHFNNRVDLLPPKLTHLEFSEWFNQPLDKLPLSLTHLIFTNFYRIKFDQPLNQLQKNFESNLEYLILSPFFIKSYESSIPPNFMRLGESKQYKGHIVYKKKQPQQQQQ